MKIAGKRVLKIMVTPAEAWRIADALVLASKAYREDFARTQHGESKVLSEEAAGWATEIHDADRDGLMQRRRP